MTSDEILTQETYPYSMGTTPVMNTIESLMGTNSNTYDTVFINILSLIRNNYTKESTASDLYRDVKEELEDVIRDTTEFMNKCTSIRSPILIVYAHDVYNNIPASISKKPIPRRIIMSVTNMMFWRYFKTNKKAQVTNNVMVQLVPFDTKVWPHHQIRELLRNQKNTNTCLLVSHVPLDFHVTRWIKSINVLESYTGKIVDVKDLPSKVFKQLDVPFNEYTHVMLGDKDFLQPVLKRKEKQRLIDLATSENWIIRTANYIKNSLIEHNFTIPVDLDRRRV